MLFPPVRTVLITCGNAKVVQLNLVFCFYACSVNGRLIL